MTFAFALTAWSAAGPRANSEDWSRFRGPNGLGTSSETSLPTTWGAGKNIVWQVDLPGPGSSSPITSGPYVFVTSYSGYGVGRGGGGKIEDLTRHLLCLDRATGEIIWQKGIVARQPEDEYGQMLAEHGYATHTPACDGERVYAFFGKTGVFAFDMKGEELWRADVGDGSAINNWGSGTSVVLHGDLVIVNANAESQAIVALGKNDGKEIWRASAKGYEGSWSTPAILKTAKREELICTVPGEVWGISLKNGGLLWYCEGGRSSAANASPVIADGVAYVLAGGPGGASALAVRGGGDDNVKESHLAWTKNVGSYVPSPIVVKDKLVWIDDRGSIQGVSIKDGETLFKERISGAGGVYASLVASRDHLYGVTRRNGTFVFELGDKPKQIAHNTLDDDSTDFNASPAIQDGRLFLRSNRRLYCIGAK